MANRVETPAPYVPSDQELNDVVATVCGLTNRVVGIGSPEGSWLKWYRDGKEIIRPAYCTDRNALPELWDHVTDWNAYLQEFWRFQACGYGFAAERRQLLTAEPRKHVIAFLRAEGKWRPEWRTE